MNIEVIISIIILLISTLLLTVIYLLSKANSQVKEPLWSLKSSRVIQNQSHDIPGLEVTYNGEKIENITVSQVLFWNNGTEIIKSQDISRSYPLRIEIDKTVEILDVRVLQSSQPSNAFDFELNKKKNTILIRFDYLDRGQGAVIQILHTGNPSLDVRVLGRITGVSSIKYIRNPINLVPHALAEVSLNP